MSDQNSAKIDETLTLLGLSKRESLCYRALLELGSSQAGKIIQKTSIPSSKIYEVLHALEQKGMVSSIIQHNITQFQATNPDIILQLLEEKKRVAQEIVPLLHATQHSTQKQSVEYFMGQKAVFTLFTTLIHDAKPKEKYLVFSINEENKSKHANLFFKNLAVRRKEKKVDTRVLKNIKHHLAEKSETHTKVTLRYTSFNLPQGITIFRNNLILLSWIDEPIAIKIESEAFATQFAKFFLDLWDHAKK